MASRRVKLVYLTDKLLKAKLLSKKPVWFEPIIKNPPLADYTPLKDPTDIILPEDPYMQDVLKRYPELGYESVEVEGFEKSPARKLAHRVMELVDMGLPKQRATEIADAEFWNNRRIQNRAYDQARAQAIREGREAPPPRKKYRQIQEIERYYLKEGLKKTLMEQKEEAEAAEMEASEPQYEDVDEDDDDD